MTEKKISTIAVSGMNGQLGKELAVLAPHFPQFEFLFLSREVFPLDVPEKIESWLTGHPVDVLINCAAYTAVDKAESESGMANQINGEAPGIISGLLSRSGGKLIQLSTDYVFDGLSSRPLDEEAVTDPVNIYGASKLMGERAAMANNPQTLILRTSWLYSAFGNNFVKTMIRLLKTKESIRVVSDQKGSPTYAADLASAILLILSAEKFIPGIYHYSNEGETTWFDFASEIKEMTGSSCTVSPVESSGYPTAARRPAYSLLDKSKIKKNYGLTIPGWKTSLAACLEILLRSEV
ncbi:MAG TPA: dTDP-4-dehydrorhamnose reductase [Puia sp.]